jgi:CHAD domain-containing protein
MAFRLKRRRAIAAQLRRVVRDALEEAAAHLRGSEPRDEAIHDARTAIKKVRAVLRLLRDPLGARYDRENDRLRDAGRRLSALRDADALEETLRSLHGQYASGAPAARAPRGSRRRVTAASRGARGRTGD